MIVFQNPFASEWLYSRRLADEIGVATVTLKAWRIIDTGLAHVRLDRLAWYRRSSFVAWLAVGKAA